MTYFSNSGHFEAFERMVCRTCSHFKPGEEGENTCPLVSASFFYNGDDAAAGVLKLLIPNDQTCAMHIERPGLVPWED